MPHPRLAREAIHAAVEFAARSLERASSWRMTTRSGRSQRARRAAWRKSIHRAPTPLFLSGVYIIVSRTARFLDFRAPDLGILLVKVITGPDLSRDR